MNLTPANQIKDVSKKFVRQLLTAEREKIRERVEGMKYNMKERSIQLSRDCNKTNKKKNMASSFGYNEALDDVLAILDEK